MTSYYYCIDPVLRQAEENGNAVGLIPVSKEPMLCTGFIDDCFVLGNPAHIMRLDSMESAQDLAQLMKDVPLYHFNMELVLDEALAGRHKNDSINRALMEAFEGRPLPEMVTSDGDNPADSLRHPELKKIPADRLGRVYINFLTRLERYQEDFGFKRNILGHRIDQFLSQFDGFLEDNHGQIRSNILLAFGLRIDHDPHKPLESYVHSGQMEGRKKRISEPHELILAWMECDHYQGRRCQDIHRVMSLTHLPRHPNWVRLDIFRFLERESMKQIFASKLIELDPQLKIVETLPHLSKALRINAAGQVDVHIQELLAQATKTGAPYYAGAALRFAEQAEIREKESHHVKLGSS